MNRKLIVYGVLLLVSFAQLLAAANPEPQLKSLYDAKQYFDLRDALLMRKDDQSADLLLYRGVVSNKFNRPKESTTYIQNYLSKLSPNTDTELVKDCYEMLADNYVKTYEYSKAAEVYRTLLAKYGQGLDAKKADDVENSARLWGALSGVPRQSVTHSSDSRIRTSKNKLGLTELPVNINGLKHAFIFDTGANLSTITASLASKLGFEIIDASIQVGSITGLKVTARLGIAPPLRIGYATINGTVFLVFEDKDLYVAPLKYQINAIIGFPIIEGFTEISFHRNGEVFIPGKDVRFAEVDVLTEILHDDGRYFYGNLGQDLVKQFEKMTLNFQTMSIMFE